MVRERSIFRIHILSLETVCFKRVGSFMQTEIFYAITNSFDMQLDCFASLLTLARYAICV